MYSILLLKVRTLAAMGDLEGAERSSSEAKRWSLAGLFSGVGIGALTLVLYLVFVSVAVSTADY